MYAHMLFLDTTWSHGATPCAEATYIQDHQRIQIRSTYVAFHSPYSNWPRAQGPQISIQWSSRRGNLLFCALLPVIGRGSLVTVPTLLVKVVRAITLRIVSDFGNFAARYCCWTASGSSSGNKIRCTR